MSKFIKNSEAAAANLPSVVLRAGFGKDYQQKDKGFTMKQTLTIPETFLGVGYTKNRASTKGGACSCPAARGRTDLQHRRGDQCRGYVR